MTRLPLLRSLVSCSLLIAAPVLASSDGNAPVTKRGPQLSSAYQRMLLDQRALGVPFAPDILQRHQLDVPDEAASQFPNGDATPVRPFGVARASAFLNPDTQANDRTGDFSCLSGCAGRPLSQSETTIAALGSFVVAGWNDSKGFCFGAVQGYGVSTNGGASFVDRGDVPALATGGRYRGDPVHWVDTSNGEFWILGLYEGGTPGSGLALMNGHFSGGTFVIDGNRQIATNGANFIDKPWGTVDPVTHNLYVTYSNFVGGSTPQLEFIRSTDGGTTWSAPLLMHDAAQIGLVQGSRVAVGPSGQVIVYWYESFTSLAAPSSKHHVRISTDGGASFGGPDVVATTFIENFTTGGAGYRRGFAPTFASLAVDRSSGTHRGRIYLAWDEAVNFYDAPGPSLGSKSEVEQNGNFANATPFTVGQTLRGTTNASAPDTLDLWKFTGTVGQTIYFRVDSATAGASFSMRVQSPVDTTLFQNMRFLAFSQDNFPQFGYTLPYTGTYHVRMFSSSASARSYRLQTSFDTPTAGERATDHRDQFVSFSDDGLSWSTPQRISDSTKRDGIFAEVAVDAEGRVHVYWHDWRDDPNGAESAEYMVSSGNGGVTWGPNVRVSDANSFWPVNACGSANQGDYQGITTVGSTVYPCWADARNGDADVFLEGVLRDPAFACPASPQVAAGGTTQVLTFQLQNAGNVSGTLSWKLEDTAGWIMSAAPSMAGAVALAASGSQTVTASVKLPSNCVPATNVVRFIVQDDAIPGAQDTCRVTMDCGVLSVPGGVTTFAFERPSPNPSRGHVVFTYALPRDGRATLMVYGVNGRAVRTLHSNDEVAGLHAVLWNGTDDAGRRVAPGMYWARLEHEGRTLQHSFTMVR